MTDQEVAPLAPSAPPRPRLNLKPRDPEAAARMEAQRQASIGKSPFGNAKPRETVIAGRVGKTEEEVLKEEVKTNYKLQLRLNPTQLDEKRAQEAKVKQAEEAATAEEDVAKKTELEKVVVERRAELDTLLEGFEKLALETAMSGTAPRMSSLRRVQAEAAGVVPGGDGTAPTGSRYHSTQGYGPGGDAGAPPPSRGFPNGQYGQAGRVGPRSQGFPDYQAQPHQGNGGRGEYQEARQGRSQYQEPRQHGAADAATSFHRHPGSYTAPDESDAGFYDTPSSFDPAAATAGHPRNGGGYRNAAGGSRREGSRHQGGFRQGGPGFQEKSSGGYSAGYTPPSLAGRGVGGEINFEESYAGGQDRF